MYSNNEEFEEYTGTVLQETEKAKLINFGMPDPIWVAKSMIKAETKLPPDNVSVFTLPTWWSIEQGLE